jgi:hypothetical protein
VGRWGDPLHVAGLERASNVGALPRGPPPPLRREGRPSASPIPSRVSGPDIRVRDREDKFYEYERGGVRENWIIDPERGEASFHVLDDAGIFRPRFLDVLKEWGFVE